MKVSLACLAAVAVANQVDDGEKKFANKEDFMTNTPPKWWSKKTLEERRDFLTKNTRQFFKTYKTVLDTPDMSLRSHVQDLIDDASRAFDDCDPEDNSVFLNTRRRRAFAEEAEGDDNSQVADEDDTDPMDETSDNLIAERKVNTGVVGDDLPKYVLNIARWIKFAVYDQGGECQKLGHKMLYRADRLRAYMMFHVCMKNGSNSADFCDWALGFKDRDDKATGNNKGEKRGTGKHPRQSPKYQNKFNFHKKQNKVYKIKPTGAPESD